MAYLVLLVDCYKRTTEVRIGEDTEEDPVEVPFPSYLLSVIDEEMR